MISFSFQLSIPPPIFALTSRLARLIVLSGLDVLQNEVSLYPDVTGSKPHYARQLALTSRLARLIILSGLDVLQNEVSLYPDVTGSKPHYVWQLALTSRLARLVVLRRLTSFRTKSRSISRYVGRRGNIILVKKVIRVAPPTV
jgi:hypothetical protein